MLDAAADLDGFDPRRIRRYVEDRFSYSALAAELDRVYRGLGLEEQMPDAAENQKRINHEKHEPHEKGEECRSFFKV